MGAGRGEGERIRDDAGPAGHARRRASDLHQPPAAVEPTAAHPACADDGGLNDAKPRHIMGCVFPTLCGRFMQ